MMNSFTLDDLYDWTEEELRWLGAWSLQYAAQLYGDEDDLLPVEEVSLPVKVQDEVQDKERFV